MYKIGDKVRCIIDTGFVSVNAIGIVIYVDNTSLFCSWENNVNQKSFPEGIRFPHNDEYTGWFIPLLNVELLQEPKKEIQKVEGWGF